jgi:CheY-like chemotaxis protein
MEEGMKGGNPDKAKSENVGGLDGDSGVAEQRQSDLSRMGASGGFAEVQATSREALRSHRGPTLLIITEDHDFGDWLLEEFKYVGAVVALATSGGEGLALLRSTPVEVVISEEGLRDLPGVELLRVLQGAPKRPKVILTTSRQSGFLDARAIQNGASAVLHKPFRMEQLFVSIARALGN